VVLLFIPMRSAWVNERQTLHLKVVASHAA
jgi:hypothetical protein